MLWSFASQLIVFLTCCTAILIAIRKHEKSAIGFAVFAFFSVFLLSVPSEFKMFLLSNVSISTGGDDLKYLERTVDSHTILLSGFIGLVIAQMMDIFSAARKVGA